MRGGAGDDELADDNSEAAPEPDVFSGGDGVDSVELTSTAVRLTADASPATST